MGPVPKKQLKSSDGGLKFTIITMSSTVISTFKNSFEHFIETIPLCYLQGVHFLCTVSLLLVVPGLPLILLFFTLRQRRWGNLRRSAHLYG